jgi:hypothetical protein
MAEIEDTGSEITAETNTDTIVQTPDMEQGTGNLLPADLDATLDSFIEKADHAPAKAPVDKAAPAKDAAVKPEDNKGAKPVAQPNDQSTTQTPTTQPLPTPARKYGDLFVRDTRGNIVDARGQVIAQAGGASRIFDKLYPYIEREQVQSAALKAKVENYERATQAARDAGLSLEEQSAGLSLMVAYKRDKKVAINFLLQQAEESGIDLSDIRQGGGGLNPAALKQTVADILEEKLARFNPFVENLQTQNEQQEVNTRAREIYNEFMETYPDVKPHTNEVATVMEAHPELTMEQAYFRLKTDVLQRGLDWTKPLTPQYVAIEQAKQGNNPRPTPNGESQLLPDLNGRAGGNGTVEHNRTEAGANDDWGSIIESAVADVRARASRTG